MPLTVSTNLRLGLRPLEKNHMPQMCMWVCSLGSKECFECGKVTVATLNVCNIKCQQRFATLNVCNNERLAATC